MAPSVPAGLGRRDQASLFYARERRSSLSGFVELSRTHQFVGSGTMAVPTITMTSQIPDRSMPTTFRTAIQIHGDGSVATQHRGLVFELGGVSIGTAVWVEDDKIGIVSGGVFGSGNDAIGTFDYGTEIPVGLRLALVLAVNPNTGLAVLWANGRELIRAQASNGTMGGSWAGSGAGSFASAVNANTNAGVPATSQIAPDGFDVVEPLSVYLGQTPRHFY